MYMQVACMLLWKYSDFPGLDNREPTMDMEQRNSDVLLLNAIEN